MVAVCKQYSSCSAHSEPAKQVYEVNIAARRRASQKVNWRTCTPERTRYRGLLNFTFRPVAFLRFFGGFCSGDEPMEACDAWRFRWPFTAPLFERDDGPSVSPSSCRLASATHAGRNPISVASRESGMIVSAAQEQTGKPAEAGMGSRVRRKAQTGLAEEAVLNARQSRTRTDDLLVHVAVIAAEVFRVAVIAELADGWLRRDLFADALAQLGGRLRLAHLAAEARHSRHLRDLRHSAAASLRR